MGCARSVISGESGRGNKLELGDFWIWPKDAGRIKSPFFSLLWECSNCASFDFSKFPSYNCRFRFCCQFCNRSAAAECKDGIFSKECFQKRKSRHSYPSKKSIMFTNLAQHCGPHSQWSHMGMLFYNLIYVTEASCSKASALGEILGVFGFKQHKENLWMAQLWAATYKKWFFGKLLPRLRGDLSNPVIIELIREKHHG